MRYLLTLLLMISIAACESSMTPSGPPLVVYASDNDPADLPELFAAFTAETGIPLTVIWGDSASNTDAVIGKRGESADVLITPNIADTWRAAEQGALRPLQGAAFASVDGFFKDPDALWVLLERRAAVIVISANAAVPNSGGYEALVGKEYQGKLCMSSISNSVNQAVVAMLIEDFGLKPAERIVRGWMLNLPVQPFVSEEQLVAALAAGDCEVGIVSSSLATPGMRNIEAAPLYAGGSAMGVGRHATNPDKAQQLVDWLIVNKPLGAPGKWNGRNIGIVGWRHEEVMLLAERASYN
jgi:iron(III) transport system substrate-binding protein